MKKVFLSGLILLLFLSENGFSSLVLKKAGPDTLSWRGGKIVFGPWVRVDDAPGSRTHFADHPQMVMDGRKKSYMYSVWQDDRDNDGNYEIFFSKSTDLGSSWSRPNLNYGGLSFSTPDTARGLFVSNSFTSNINYGPQPKIAVDSKSDTGFTYLYLIWADDTTGLIQIKMARSQARAQSDTLGNRFLNLGIRDRNLTNVNRNPYIAVDDSGRIHWAWGTGGTNQDSHPWIGYNISTDRWTTFRASDSIVNDDRSQANIYWSRSTKWENRKPAISIDPRGVAVVAWNDNYGNTSHFGIHLAAYNDTLGAFGGAQSLFNTFTQTNGGAFGGNLYPPSLRVVLVDTIDNFFLVWQDLLEDTTGGNIYSVRGWVVPSLADMDIYDNVAGLVNNLMDFGKIPAGPPDTTIPFQLVNTDSANNPDTFDGPSTDTLLVNVRADSSSLVLRHTSGVNFQCRVNVPSTLRRGQIAQGTVTLFIPDGSPTGDYTGRIIIKGNGSMVSGDTTSDFFNVKVTCGAPSDLRRLKIFPNPFKPSVGHTKIYFYGLPQGSIVRIYDLSGTLLKELRQDTSDGLATWDPTSDPNCASGIYFYFVDGVSEKKKGKISIIK